MTPARLRIATWNVHSCIGIDGRHSPDRVRRLTRSIGADIVALQEVDSRVNGRDGFEELGDALGLRAVATNGVRHADPKAPTESFGLYGLSGRATSFMA